MELPLWNEQRNGLSRDRDGRQSVNITLLQRDWLIPRRCAQSTELDDPLSCASQRMPAAVSENDMKLSARNLSCLVFNFLSSLVR
jgi:hypothetical protein